MKITTIIGARPQFIKAAMVSRAIAAHNQQAGKEEIKETIIHTGQHYDTNMSAVFFRELNIPAPEVNLDIGSGSHGDTTGRMLATIEKELMHRRPERVLVYGDTNSTLAGALAAAKLHIPVAHVEAGLRSFNKKMPEELNRIMTDHVSDLLFCPTTRAVTNLGNEGIIQSVHHVGDVMFDAALVFAGIAERQSSIIQNLHLYPKEYCLATVHRAENTDDDHRLGNIIQGLEELGRNEATVIFLLHPRTRAALERIGYSIPKDTNSSPVRFIAPVSFLDMVMLEKHSQLILTDSGGVQKEAYFHGVPCITLRDDTEWVETVEAGWNKIVGSHPENFFIAPNVVIGDLKKEYGSGKASEILVYELSQL